MNKPARDCRILILMLIVVSCKPTLQVTSDHDKHIDFTQYKTYSLFAGAGNNISSLNEDRILRSIRVEMEGKGFTMDSTHPDLFVNATAIVKKKADVSSHTSYYGYGGVARPYYWGMDMGAGYTSYDITYFKEGSLIIDILDASTRKLVWQGTGNSRIDEPASNDADSRISGAVNKIMASFPPPPGK